MEFTKLFFIWLTSFKKGLKVRRLYHGVSNFVLFDNFFRSFVHFQSYKAFTDKGSGIFPDLASTTSLMFGRGSISSNEAPSAADEGELGE